MNTFLVLLGLARISALQAAQFEPETLYFGATGVPVELAEIVKNTTKGSIIVIGEYHDNVAHHQHQISLIRELLTQGHEVALGMEFLQTPYQYQVNEYLAGKLTEDEFLKQINWGKNDFGLYREQIKLANGSSQDVLAINAPSSLTSRVSKVGIGGLTDLELSQLPPEFSLGNDLYYDRFFQTMQAHVPTDKIFQYFQAQSIWDDTMAWKIAEHHKVHPLTTIVVIVGDFHVRNFGGLPYQLKLRTGSLPIVISQMNMQDLSPAEVESEMSVDPKYGARAHFIWTSQE